MTPPRHTVPNDHPELRGWLACLLRGEDVAYALHDWLEERGDERAELFKMPEVPPGRNTVIIWPRQFADIACHFDVHTCLTCQLDRPGQMAWQDPAGAWHHVLPYLCPECSGLGWSQLVTRERVTEAKVERWRRVDPRRVPLT